MKIRFERKVNQRKEKKKIQKALKKKLDLKDKLKVMLDEEEKINKIISDIEKAKKEEEVNVTPKAQIPEKNEEPPEQPKELTLNEKIEDISGKLNKLIEPKDSKEKKKMLKLPAKVKRQLKKLAIKNKVIVEILRENRSSQTVVAKIINDYIWIDGVPHKCSKDFIYLSEGKYPKIYLPEWELNPVGTKDWIDKVKDGMPSYPIATIIRLLQDKDVIKSGSKMETKSWIWIGIALIAIIYLIMA